MACGITAETGGGDRAMNHIDDYLLPDEHVVYRTYLHWMVFARPALLFVIAIGAVITASANGLLLANALVPLVGLDALNRFVLYLSAEIGVTDKRVLGKTGWLSGRSVDTPLSTLDGFAVNQSVLGRMLGYGTVVVTSAGGLRRRLPHIDDPIEFRRRVQQQRET